jgi:hypothetical protein
MMVINIIVIIKLTITGIIIILSKTGASWSHYYTFGGSLMDVLGSFVQLVGTSQQSILQTYFIHLFL